MTLEPSESVLILPNILAGWPWKRNINPHHLQVTEESLTWIQNVLGSTPHMRRALDLGNFGLLVSLSHPGANKDVLRAYCDFTNMAFILDDTIESMTSHEAQQIGGVVMDAIRNPDKTRPIGECAFGEATRQFWKSVLKCASACARRRFIERYEDFLVAVSQQLQDLARSRIRNIDEYILLRRETSATKLGLVFLEFELNLPDEVFENPVIQRLPVSDMYSYNIEQARGDAAHNIVTVIMHHENVGLNEAMRWIGDYISKLMGNFLEDLRRVPSFGEEFQEEVNCYLDGLGNWIRAMKCWSFESRRYFGNDGLEIQQSRKVLLLPRIDPTT